MLLHARGELGGVAVEPCLAQHLLEDAAVADVLVEFQSLSISTFRTFCTAST